MSIEDYGHKVADGYDKIIHSERGLKGWIRRHPLTAVQIVAGGAAGLGFIVGLIL